MSPKNKKRNNNNKKKTKSRNKVAVHRTSVDGDGIRLPTQERGRTTNGCASTNNPRLTTSPKSTLFDLYFVAPDEPDYSEALAAMPKDITTKQVLNPRDKLDIRNFPMHTLDFDARTVAKILPHTAEDLYHGLITPVELVDCLGPQVASIFVRSNVYVFAYDISWIIAVRSSVHLVDSSSYGLRYRLRNAAARDIFRKSFIEGMARALKKRLTMKSITPTAHNLKYAFDEACEKCAAVADKILFRGQKGSFLSQCPFYKQPLRNCDAFVPAFLVECAIDPIEIKHKEEITLSYLNNLFNVAWHIADGVHLSDRICWGCGTCPDTVSSCGECRVANYCSKKCQHNDWKDGHKSCCKYAKSMGLFLRDVMDTVTLSTNVPAGICGEAFSSSECAGYDTVIAAFYSLKQNKFHRIQAITNGGPSLRIFFKNLELIAKGGFWVFDDNNEDHETTVVPDVAAYLCFDVFASKETLEDVKLLLEELVAEEAICKISAEKFVALFQPSYRNSRATRRFQRGVRYKAQHLLYLNCHPNGIGD